MLGLLLGDSPQFVQEASFCGASVIGHDGFEKLIQWKQGEKLMLLARWTREFRQARAAETV